MPEQKPKYDYSFLQNDATETINKNPAASKYDYSFLSDDAQQPQEERGFFDSILAGAAGGAAGTFGGQADFLNTFTGVGGDVGDALNKVAQNNARRKEYTIAEMLPFASDYWTNPEGAAYDAGSQLGSMAVLGGEAAALSAGLAAAGVGGAGALATTAAGKAAQAGLPWLAKLLNSKVGTAMVGNMLTTPFEAASEGGGTGRTVEEEGGSESEQQSAAAKNFGVQLALLSMTNAIESMGLGGMIAEAGGKKAFTRTLAGIFGNAAQQMYEEGAQTSADEFARGKQSIADVFNPAGWSDDAWNAAGAGFTGGLMLGAGGAVGGRLVGNKNSANDTATDGTAPDGTAPATTASNENDGGAGTTETVVEAPTQTAEASGDYKAARDFLRGEMENMDAGEDYNRLDELVSARPTDENRAAVIAEARTRGFGQQTTQQPTAEAPTQETGQTQEEPTPASPVEAAKENVRNTAETVANNGGQPTFNQPTATQTVETPAVDNVTTEAGKTNTQTEGAAASDGERLPQNKIENEIVDIQKRLRRIADDGKFNGVKLSKQRIGELTEAGQTGDVSRMVEIARRFKIPASHDLVKYAKDQKAAQENQKPVEQFDPNAGQQGTATVQQPTAQAPTPTQQPVQITQQPTAQAGEVQTPVARTPKEELQSRVDSIVADVKSGKMKPAAATKKLGRTLNDAADDNVVTVPEYEEIYDKAEAEINKVKEAGKAAAKKKETAKKPAEKPAEKTTGLTKASVKGDNKGKSKAAEKGGKSDGNTEERERVGDLPRDGRGSEERPGVRESETKGNRSTKERPKNNGELGNIPDSDGNVRLKHEKPQGADKVNALRKKRNLPALNFYVTNDAEEFAASLARAKESNPRGDYVDAQTADDLKGCTLIMVEGADAGVAIKPDGDIIAVHRGEGLRGVAPYLLLIARENGGTKMDCFGEGLVRLYNSVGFKAVSRLPYAEGIVDSELLDRDKPYVYVLMATEENNNQVLARLDKDEPLVQTREELEALPLYEGHDYDKAISYRDAELYLDGATRQMRKAGVKKQQAELMKVLLRARAAAQYPNNPMQYFIEHPIAYTKENGLTAKGDEQYYQSAWHGSPHVFDKFDLGHVGTGEGAAVHGYGLYFAADKKIAITRYRDRLTKEDPVVTVGGNEYIWDLDRQDWINRRTGEGTGGMGNPLGNLVWEIGSAEGDIQRVKRRLEAVRDGLIEENSNPELLDVTIKTLKLLEKSEIGYSANKGSLFEVDIPESDTMLDEQKTLDEQSDSVKNGLRKALNSLPKELRKHFARHISQEVRSRDIMFMDEEATKDQYTVDDLRWFLETDFDSPTHKKIAALVDAGYNRQEAMKIASDEAAFSKARAEGIAKYKEATSRIKRRFDELFDNTLVNDPGKAVDILQRRLTGKQTYNVLTLTYFDENSKTTKGEAQKKASLLLNEAGIEGITYVGGIDGRCYVVFNDEAVKIINRYNQMVNGERKGAIGWSDEGEAIVSMFEGSDTSTVIHETGHYFVEALARDVASGKATEQQKADFDKLLKYAGVDGLKAWQKLDFEQRRSAHEAWATAFEQYLMEGKAPTKELKPVFERFKKWLHEVYNSVKDFVANNPDAIALTNDVRGVFDRMFATQEAIESGKDSKTKQRKETKQSDDVQPEVRQEVAESEDNDQNEVVLDNGWAEQTAEVMGELAGDLEDLLAEISAPKKKRQPRVQTQAEIAEAREDAEIEKHIRDAELTEEAQQEESALNKIDAFVDKLEAKYKTPIKAYFKKKPDRKDFCATVITKNPKVTVQEVKGYSNNRYFVKYDGIEFEEEITLSEARVISGVAGVAMEKKAPAAKNQATKVEDNKPKYISEIEDYAEDDFLDYAEEKFGRAKTKEFLAKLQQLNKDGVTWAKSIREGVFKDLQNRDGLLDAEYYSEYLLKVKDSQALDEFYEYLYKRFLPEVKKLTRKNAGRTKDLHLSEAEMLQVFKKAIGKDATDEQARTAYQYALNTLVNKNLDEVPVQELKELAAEALAARPSEERITRKTGENLSTDEANDIFADALEALEEDSGMKFSIAEDDNDQQNVELDKFNHKLLGTLIKAGDTLIQQGYDTAGSFRNAMVTKFSAYADRIRPLLDSIWEFLRKLPSTVKTNVEAMTQAIFTAGNAYMRGIRTAGKLKPLLEKRPLLYEQIKDYLEAAFAAIKRYPRKNNSNVVQLNERNEGGGNNEHVRVAGTDAASSDSRGNGERLEGSTGTADGSSTQQSQAENTESGNEGLRGRAGRPLAGNADSAPVRGSGTDSRGAQGNQQGGRENADDTQRGSGNTDAGRRSGANEARNAGSARRMGEVPSSQTTRRGGNVSSERPTSSVQGLNNLKTENIPIEAGNVDNIQQSLPLLFKEQCEDIAKTEKRVFINDGKGMLIANGTGTGKTLTGLGVAKRFLMQGKKNILIVVPGSEIGRNWIKEGEYLDIKDVSSITTNKYTPDSVNVISYKSLSENKNLLDNKWDLIICDESHNLASGKDSTEENPTDKVQALRAVIGHEQGFEGWMMLKYGDVMREVEKLGALAAAKRERAAAMRARGQNADALIKEAVNLAIRYNKGKDRIAQLRVKEKAVFEQYRKDNVSKVLLLSATPFSYSSNIYLAEGILFNYSDLKTDYRGYMVDRFGYSISENGKLKAPQDQKINNVNEVAFHDALVDSGAMTNRRLVVDKDYNRKFVRVKAGIGEEIDRGFDILNAAQNGFTESDLDKYMRQRFTYMTKKRILESLKAEAAIPMIKDYIKQGKKVVLFHDTKTDEALVHPFKIEKQELETMPADQQEAYNRFRKAHPDLVNLDLGQLKPALEIIKNAFGKDVLAVNGNISKTQKEDAVKAFNDDNFDSRGRDDSTGGKLIMLTVDAGKEGISLHDTTGKNQRVLINLGMPTKPTDAIQMEGRIYRVGQASNAMFRYLATGTKMERRAFMERVNNRSRSAENMALGDEARMLDEAFSRDFMKAMDQRLSKFDAAKDMDDSGGKVADSQSRSEIIDEMLTLDLDNELRAKVDEMAEADKAERDEKVRTELLTPENERRFMDRVKKAFQSKSVTKASDGVYVVQLPNGRNVWIDLNTSQAMVLSKMSDADKKKLRSAADVKTSNFQVRGFYESKGRLAEAGDGLVDVIHLTEAAKEGTLHHELFHFVHNAILNVNEKRWLDTHYLKKMEQQLGKEAFEKLTPTERMDRIYEMEAEDYRMFVEKQEAPKGPLQNLFNRIKNFVVQVAEAIGINTPESLYLKVRSGKLYTRGVERNTVRKAEAQAQMDEAAAQAGPKVLQAAENADGTLHFSIAEDGTIEGKRTKDDIAATLAAANAKAEQAAEEGGIIVKEREKTELEKRGEGPVFFKEWLSSPSRIAEKHPVFKSFYNIFNRAQETQEKLRNRWNKNFNEALGHLKTEEEKDQFLDLNVSGEYEQKEYTIKELREQGYSENVIKAYTRTRQLIRNIWKEVNDAHRGLKTHAESVDGRRLRELLEDKFVENLVIRDDLSGKFVPARGYKTVPGINYDVRYDKAKVYKSAKPEAMSKSQLEELKQSPYVKILKVKPVEYYNGAMSFYEVTTERVAPPIGKITGYLPHMFEQWMVMVETEEGLRPIGSGKTLKEAHKEAEKFQQANPKLKIYVEPKIFDPNTFMGDSDEASGVKFNGSDAVVVSDAEYIKMVQALAANNRMSVAEAKAALDGATKRSSRNRFFGALRQRKGRTGYDTDVIGTLGRYITQSSRYVALQPAKSQAIPLYERTFQKNYEAKTSAPMERLVQDYIRYNNGNPTQLEKEINNWLNSMKWWRENLQATYGDRAALALTSKINSQVSKAKLGFLNVSSAIVNLSQLMNTVGLIGMKSTEKGFEAMTRMNTRDKRVILETGITANIAMDTVGGFSSDRKNGSDWRKKKATTAIGKFFQAYNDMADKSMVLFKKTDTVTRMVAVLGAYYDGIDKGMKHEQAIAYAKDVNRKANFDYGAADAPGAFRKLSGTVAGDLFLLFKKYPVKELEMMAEMAPWSNRSSRAQKARFWGMYFLLAGVFGFPGSDYLDELLEDLLGYKPSVLAKAFLFKTFGDNPFTRSLVYGIGGAAGVDVSRRVGLADVVPSEDRFIGLVSGPAGSTLVQLAKAARSGDEIGVLKAWSPALGHTVEAVQGYRTNSKGQIAARYEGLDRALKAAGFRPVEESITMDLQSAVYAERTRKRDVKAATLQEMAERRANGEKLDSDDIKRLKELGITGKQLQQAVQKVKMTNKERIQSSLTKTDKKFVEGTLLEE